MSAYEPSRPGLREVKWTGQKGGPLIATETNPYLRHDETGRVLSLGAESTAGLLLRLTLPVTDDCGCLAGAVPAMDTPEGVQRCDECETLPGDLDAARALANALGWASVFYETEAPA